MSDPAAREMSAIYSGPAVRPPRSPSAPFNHPLPAAPSVGFTRRVCPGRRVAHATPCLLLLSFSPHWHPSTTHLPSPRQPYIMGRWACSASLPRSARRLQPDPGDRSQGPAQVALGRQPSQTTRTLIHVEVPCPGWVPGRRALGVCSLVHGRPSRSRAGRSLSGDMTHPRDHISEPYRSC